MARPQPPDGWPFAPLDRPSKIVCIGRNYEEHAKELGHTVPTEPILFLKPPSSLLPSGAEIRLPEGIGRVDHEIELGLVIGRRLTAAPARDAAEAIRGWCLALDLTARDEQAEAKRTGRPWAAAKGRDGFCPVSTLLPRGAVDPSDARLTLRVNGEVRQDGSTRDMIFPVADLVAHASRIMTLEPGDLLLTGTPSGVGPLHAGDHIVGSLDGRVLLEHSVV